MGRQEQSKLRPSGVVWKERQESTSRECVTNPLFPARQLTFDMCFICGIQLKIDQRAFPTPSKRKLDVKIVQSDFQIELAPSEVGNYHRVVIKGTHACQAGGLNANCQID